METRPKHSQAMIRKVEKFYFRETHPDRVRSLSYHVARAQDTLGLLTLVHGQTAVIKDCIKLLCTRGKPKLSDSDVQAILEYNKDGEREVSYVALQAARAKGAPSAEEVEAVRTEAKRLDIGWIRHHSDHHVTPEDEEWESLRVLAERAAEDRVENDRLEEEARRTETKLQGIMDRVQCGLEVSQEDLEWKYQHQLAARAKEREKYRRESQRLRQLAAAALQPESALSETSSEEDVVILGSPKRQCVGPSAAAALQPESAPPETSSDEDVVIHVSSKSSRAGPLAAAALQPGSEPPEGKVTWTQQEEPFRAIFRSYGGQITVADTLELERLAGGAPLDRHRWNNSSIPATAVPLGELVIPEEPSVPLGEVVPEMSSVQSEESVEREPLGPVPVPLEPVPTSVPIPLVLSVQSVQLE